MLVGFLLKLRFVDLMLRYITYLVILDIYCT